MRTLSFIPEPFVTTASPVISNKTTKDLIYLFLLYSRFKGLLLRESIFFGRMRTLSFIPEPCVTSTASVAFFDKTTKDLI